MHNGVPSVKAGQWDDLLSNRTEDKRVVLCRSMLTYNPSRKDEKSAEVFSTTGGHLRLATSMPGSTSYGSRLGFRLQGSGVRA